MADVIVSPEAEAQIRAIDSWWRENRLAAPELLLQELAEAFGTLAAVTLAGRAAPYPELRGLRRLLLRASGYHVYYAADDQTFWSFRLERCERSRAQPPRYDWALISRLAP